MATKLWIGLKMNARLDDGAAFGALRPQPFLHRVQDLIVRQGELGDVGAVQIGQVKLLISVHLAFFLLSAS